MRSAVPHTIGRWNPRYLVPDLSPQARIELATVQPKILFVGESPHVSEIESEILEERRPLCGKSGREWWSLLSELLEGSPNPDVSLERELALCKKFRLALINSVQYPLDPRIAAVYPDADPETNLGFGKLTGEYSLRRVKTNAGVQRAIQDLRDRLNHPSVQNLQIHPLGGDAEFLVTQALGPEGRSRLGVKVPHPAAWWRKEGFYRDLAERVLRKIIQDAESASS